MILLTLPAETESVLPEPPAASGSSLGLGVVGALAQAAGLLAASGQTAEFPVLVHSIHDPVDLGINIFDPYSKILNTNLTFGSRLIVGWATSTMMTSKYL